jgi:hypothetical protein
MPVALIFLVLPADAEDHGFKSPLRLEHERIYHADQKSDEWFRSLKQPGSGFSCCDISDCKRTEADWRGGQWWAVVSGEWTPIPRDKELDKQSLDGDAYVCSSPNRRIYCFVRPDIGS